MLGQNFPISEYYRPHIIDAVTIVRNGPWWSAVLLIADPKTKKPFIALYRWQRVAGNWKTRKRFTLRTLAETTTTVDAILGFARNLAKD
jgi:hypothetical protein